MKIGALLGASVFVQLKMTQVLKLKTKFAKANQTLIFSWISFYCLPLTVSWQTACIPRAAQA